MRDGDPWTTSSSCWVASLAAAGCIATPVVNAKFLKVPLESRADGVDVRWQAAAGSIVLILRFSGSGQAPMIWAFWVRQ